jgi:predicted ATP-binding protein involved in virulence
MLRGIDMRVRSIGVKGLFGVFNHEIPVHSSERVTIIHGPNGFGKTVILRMIASLIEGDESVFEHIPFTEFYVTLENGMVATIGRKIAEPDETGKPQVKLQFSLRDAEGITQEVSPVPARLDAPRALLTKVDRLIPTPYRVSGSGWTDGVRQFSLVEILEKYPSAASIVPRQYRAGVFFEALKDLQVFFVEANRLSAESSRSRRSTLTERLSLTQHAMFDEPDSPPPSRVKQYSDDIVQRIQAVLADYAKHSQESDRTFPERLVRFIGTGMSAIDAQEILSRMTELEKIRQRLISLGLLDSETGLSDLTEEDVKRASQALTIYVADVQEKLRVFDDIAQRIGSLMDIINDRFQYKRLRIDRRHGFRLLSSQNEAIQLEDLSSGEQHELVVLYELLFRAPQKGMVLVDEPEISLHVAWQSRFLSDLIQILEVTDTYAIVATHSPVIIGTRWDLAVELRGPATSQVDVPNA